MSINKNEAIHKHIRIKYSFPLIILTVGCCLVVFISYIFLFNNEFKRSMFKKIDVAAMVIEHEINNLKANGRIAAIGIADNQDLINAIENNDRNEIIKISKALVTMAQVDYCTITDNKGIVIARTHEPDTYGDSVLNLHHIKCALDGKNEVYIAQSITITLGVHAGSPVYDSKMNIIGAVSVGYNLDDQKFIDNLKTMTMCEIGIFFNDKCIVTTVHDINDSHNFEAINKYIPIYGTNNEVIGMAGVSYYAVEERKTITRFILTGIILTLAVIAVCIFIARLIMKIVERRLNDMMNEVSRADEKARIAIEENNILVIIREIMNNLDIMIFVTDPKTSDIIFMNEFMKKHFNLMDDPVGKKCYKVLKNRRSKRCGFCPCHKLDKEPDKTIIWDERDINKNNIFRRIDRYIKWLNGQMVHIQHSFDMTELIHAKESAELSNRSKGIFLAQMSHEIRTPMNAILGISEIQLQDKTLSITAEEGYRKINESGSLLLNIINDILDFSKIDAGKLEIVCAQYNIPNLINDTAQLNRLRYEAKPISFIISLDENTPYRLIGDELRIKQILNNLLSNAFKYTDSGEVELSVYAETNNDDEMVQIIFRVRDTGQGMTAGQISRLFNEYSRFNLETNRSITGTGLGMSITKGLIDMMNGEIHVDSIPDKGSVITVRLPQILCDDSVCGGDVVKSLREFNFHNTELNTNSRIVYEYMPYGKVLIVDDVESNIYVAKGFLKPYGLNIETTKSGFEAIEKIKNDNYYDIVFMDHMMPVMDGIKTTKILRDMGYSNSIIALTANAVVGQEEMFLSNGFDGFISKPIDSRELNDILIELIRNKKKETSEAISSAADSSQFNQYNNESAENDNFTALAVLDIKNAVSVLEDILPKINADFEASGAANLELFITTVHGMKSVLLNIGESRLSNTASKLEQAGNNNDINVIHQKTPEFLLSLGALLEKIKYPDVNNNTAASRDDMIFFYDKLNEIKTACINFIPGDAKKAISGLKQKTWQSDICFIIDEISIYFLRGEYSKAVSAIENVINSK